MLHVSWHVSWPQFLTSFPLADDGSWCPHDDGRPNGCHACKSVALFFVLGVLSGLSVFKYVVSPDTSLHRSLLSLSQMQGFMAVPMNVPPGTPPGLEYLTALDYLFIKQHVDLIEMVSGFDIANKYKVKNGSRSWC